VLLRERVLRRIFGTKRMEVAGGWRRLHSEELHNLYHSANITRLLKPKRMGWIGQLVRMREMRNAYKILLGKPEGKRPLGRPRHRWGDNIGLDLRELG